MLLVEAVNRKCHESKKEVLLHEKTDYDFW